MTTEEQIQSSNIQRVNGTEDNGTHEDDSETTPTTLDASSEPPVRRSRFFRTKRKQRAQDEPSNVVDSNSDVSNEPINSSGNPEQPAEQTSIEEIISTTDTNSPLNKTTTPKRASSPPPPPPSFSICVDDADELDGSSTSEKPRFSLPAAMFDTERGDYLKKSPDQKKLSADPRPSLPTIYAGYQRKKSQSVKLTRIDPLDSYPKKNVRFADDFGLDLSQVRVIKSDELPHVPSAAFKDLNISDDDNSTSFYQERMRTITYLEQKFDNPIHAHGFDDRVLRHKVVLEQANAIDNRLYGTVKIISFGLSKRIKIRLTTDNWITYLDYDATYIVDSYDGTHDRFTFTIDVDRDRICVGNNIQFCVGYESSGGPEYWDNNYQQNYRFDCISRTIPDYSS